MDSQRFRLRVAVFAPADAHNLSATPQHTFVIAKSSNFPLPDLPLRELRDVVIRRYKTIYPNESLFQISKSTDSYGSDLFLDDRVGDIFADNEVFRVIKGASIRESLPRAYVSDRESSLQPVARNHRKRSPRSSNIGEASRDGKRQRVEGPDEPIPSLEYDHDSSAEDKRNEDIVPDSQGNATRRSVPNRAILPQKATSSRRMQHTRTNLSPILGEDEEDEEDEPVNRQADAMDEDVPDEVAEKALEELAPAAAVSEKKEQPTEKSATRPAKSRGRPRKSQPAAEILVTESEKGSGHVNSTRKTTPVLPPTASSSKKVAAAPTATPISNAIPTSSAAATSQVDDQTPSKGRIAAARQARLAAQAKRLKEEQLAAQKHNEEQLAAKRRQEEVLAAAKQEESRRAAVAAAAAEAEAAMEEERRQTAAKEEQAKKDAAAADAARADEDRRRAEEKLRLDAVAAKEAQDQENRRKVAEKAEQQKREATGATESRKAAKEGEARRKAAAADFKKAAMEEQKLAAKEQRKVEAAAKKPEAEIKLLSQRRAQKTSNSQKSESPEKRGNAKKHVAEDAGASGSQGLENGNRTGEESPEKSSLSPSKRSDAQATATANGTAEEHHGPAASSPSARRVSFATPSLPALPAPRSTAANTNSSENVTPVETPKVAKQSPTKPSKSSQPLEKPKAALSSSIKSKTMKEPLSQTPDIPTSAQPPSATPSSKAVRADKETDESSDDTSSDSSSSSSGRSRRDSRSPVRFVNATQNAQNGSSRPGSSHNQPVQNETSDSSSSESDSDDEDDDLDAKKTPIPARRSGEKGLTRASSPPTGMEKTPLTAAKVTRPATSASAAKPKSVIPTPTPSQPIKSALIVNAQGTGTPSSTAKLSTTPIPKPMPKSVRPAEMKHMPSLKSRAAEALKSREQELEAIKKRAEEKLKSVLDSNLSQKNGVVSEEEDSESESSSSSGSGSSSDSDDSDGDVKMANTPMRPGPGGKTVPATASKAVKTKKSLGLGKIGKRLSLGSNLR